MCFISIIRTRSIVITIPKYISKIHLLGNLITVKKGNSRNISCLMQSIFSYFEIYINYIIPGPEGMQGVAGPKGPSGEKGPTGEAGRRSESIAGDRGMDGPPGPKGGFGRFGHPGVLGERGKTTWNN